MDSPARFPSSLSRQYLAAVDPKFKCNVISLLPIDYELYLPGALEKFPKVKRHVAPVVCFANGTHDFFIGDAERFMLYLRQKWDYVDGTHAIFYERAATMHMRGYMEKSGREFCEMEILIDEEEGAGDDDEEDDGKAKASARSEGKLVFELFTDVAPKTCENFKAFVLGGDERVGGRGYEGTPVSRTVRDGWIQAGDVMNKWGSGKISIYGETFPDEVLKVRHDKVGILSMVRMEKRDRNGCQFFVAQCPLPFLDGQRVAFGRLIDGWRVMKVLNKLDAYHTYRPRRGVTIGKCAMITAPGPAEVQKEE